jgi:hypothetical protein
MMLAATLLVGSLAIPTQAFAGHLRRGRGAWPDNEGYRRGQLPQVPQQRPQGSARNGGVREGEQRRLHGQKLLPGSAVSSCHRPRWVPLGGAPQKR